MKSCKRPSTNVRRIHKTPIGPTGAAIEKPIMSPFNKNEISIFLRTGNPTLGDGTG